MPRRADIDEQTMRFTELLLATRIIAQQRGEFGAPLVQGGSEEQDAVLLDQGGALVEETLDLVLRRRRPSTLPTEKPGRISHRQPVFG